MWGSIIAAGAAILGTILQNVYNTRQIKETNKENRQLVAMQNTAQAKESEKAYQRSLPVMQTNAMEQAGMSKAGAINALNGGGSYQPAPVNAAQGQAPQIDVSQAINAMQGFAQLAEQRRQFNEQQKLAKQQHDLDVRKQGFEEQKWRDEEPIRTNTKKLQDFDIEVKDALKNHKDGNMLVKGALAENAANIAERKLNTYKANLFAALYELPADLVAKFIKYLKRDIEDADYLIESIKKGKLTGKEVENQVEKIGNLETINESDGEYYAIYDSAGNLHFHKK